MTYVPTTTGPWQCDDPDVPCDSQYATCDGVAKPSWREYKKKLEVARKHSLRNKR